MGRFGEKALAFFRRHIIWVALLAVMLPLITILAVQYRSLAALEWTLPVARKDFMRNYLVRLAGGIENFYKESAEQILDVPASAFVRNSNHELDLSGVVAHFERQCPRMATRLFIGVSGENSRSGSYVLVLFYKPEAERKLDREPGSRDWRAAHAACASWLVHSLTNTVPESPGLSVDERDPEVRVVIKPIIDNATGKVAGAAGMILNKSFLKDELVPAFIENTLAESFPDDYQDAVVSLRDSSGLLLAANHEKNEPRDEVAAPMQFVFSDCRLGMGMLHVTEEQWAKRLFGLNLSLSVVMTALLIGGLVMALRTAAREMKLSQMKADFVSNVSHELRTPLASIRVFGEFLRLGRVRETEKVREYGEYIENESRRLTRLINNILDFSKIESGRKTYKFEKADVSEVVAETLQAFELRLSQSGFKIIFERPEEPLNLVMIDRDAIAQACTNLLDNAVKYSGSGREIVVRLEQTKSQVSISVTDEGIGVPREERDKIFEKFYRISKGLIHDVKGSGLGLSIVKHIVEAHEGNIGIESRTGAGSTFTIHLPLAHNNSQSKA